MDTPRAANVALGVARADAESTHVLCRHPDESTTDFTKRVQRRIERIQRTRRVRSLWYVVGPEAVRVRCSLPLLQSLLPLLESGASLTVVGPGSHQGAVFEWIDSLIQHRENVTVRAQLYADAPTVPLRGARARAHAAAGSRAASSPLPQLPAWFPIDGTGHGASAPGHAL